MGTTDDIRAAGGRWAALFAAFFGWFFAGTIMAATQQAMGAAVLDLLARSAGLDLGRYEALQRAHRADPDALSAEDGALLDRWRKAEQSWFAFCQCAFLFGAAAGGFLLGRLGDAVGRAKGLAASVLCFALGSLAAGLAQTPWQLVLIWFVACLGVGGTWPNGVALLSETWSHLSKPAVAGLLGTSANVGLFALTTLVRYVPITADDWRWVTYVTAAPVPLGLLILVAVPESSRWRAARSAEPTARPRVFASPLLRTTVLGIVLATVPMVGGWGSANWMLPWADQASRVAATPDPTLKSRVGQARALPGIVGSLVGGWIGHVVGRRRSYALTSLACLVCAQYTFWALLPTDVSFLVWVGLLGFFSGVYFGWLPLFLPELFPTAARSTGSGVAFNFGRILTAATVFGTGAFTSFFGGDYAVIGRVTSLVFVAGVVAACLPDTAGLASSGKNDFG